MRINLCRVYSIYGETVMDSVIDRMTGRIGEAAQHKAGLLTARAFAEDRYGPSARVAWSRRLGCSCGCSPGWLVYATTSGHDMSVLSHFEDAFASTRQIGRYRQVPCPRDFSTRAQRVSLWRDTVMRASPGQ